MRGLFLDIILLAATAVPAAAQIGKQVVVQAGTPADKEVAAIQAATNREQKLALLNKFAAAHPSGDLALLADNMYVSLYSASKNYSKAYAFGNKALALDPNDLNVAVELIRDAQLQGNTRKMVTYGVQVGQMITRYKAQSAPAGMAADQWAATQQQTLASIQPQVSWVVKSVHTAISGEPASSAKTAMLNQMSKAFPSSTYAQTKK